MEILQKQSYYNWFQWLGKKMIEWGEKSDSVDIQNAMKATSEIGMYVLALEKENLILEKTVALERSKRREAEAELYHFKKCCESDSEPLKIPKTTKKQRVQLNEGYNKN